MLLFSRTTASIINMFNKKKFRIMKSKKCSPNETRTRKDITVQWIFLLHLV